MACTSCGYTELYADVASRGTDLADVASRGTDLADVFFVRPPSPARP
ncbi:zinc ribbon domain-containing protein [Halobacterium noricense]|nr:zinc ribbon domain-containing protein [Halobacterium noricense]UHH25874.1 zinc ribbon domain-containing protein [Halobacterium noricense]